MQANLGIMLQLSLKHELKNARSNQMDATSDLHTASSMLMVCMVNSQDMLADDHHGNHDGLM